MTIAAGFEQERLIRTAKERGHRVVATAWPPTYADALPLADEGLAVDPRDLARVFAVAREKEVQAVVSDQCDYSYFAAAFVAERMGLPGPGLSAAQVSTNKHEQCLRLARAGLRVPEFELCATLEEVRAALAKIGYPAIFKPLDNRGNCGVNRVDGPEDVREAFFEAVANAHSRRLLVQRFIDGVMATVEGFQLPGGAHVSLAISSKVMLGGKKRVAMELRYPGEFSPEVDRRLRENNQKVMEALGYGPGPTHVEYMVTAEGVPWFIEAHNRGGGVMINSHIVPAVTGVDTTSLQLDFATGVPLSEVRPREPGRAAVLSFFAFRGSGKITAVRGLEKARSLPGVLALRLLVREGDTLEPITTDAGRHGFVIATAATPRDALALARQAHETVEAICR